MTPRGGPVHISAVIDDMFPAAVTAIPVTYRGTRFASTLEADWARTFDELGWAWQYEPVAVKVDGAPYRPDFYLPAHRTWCEVKGPHNERLGKAHALQRAVAYDEWEWASELVVVLRPPGPGETAMFEGTAEGQDIVLYRCPECGHYGFMDHAGLWSCRLHMRVQRRPNKFWTAPGGALYWPGEFPFTRVKRGRS